MKTAKDFDKFLLSVSKSKAHATLCEKVYGEDHCQLNMLDKTQLEELIKSSNLNSKKIFADIGCGLGRMTQLISYRTGSRGIGYDFAPATIEYLRSSSKVNCQFELMDLNGLSLSQKFDAVISIDSLYFVEDLQKVLREVFRHMNPGSRFLAFYTQRPRKDIPDLKYDAHGTLLGRALKSIGIHYQWSDYSRAEVDFWNRMDLELQKMKPVFEAEGNKDLYTDRRDETDKALGFIRNGTHCRFLYTVRFG